MNKIRSARIGFTNGLSCEEGRTNPRLGGGDAAAEAGDGFGFVGVGGDGLDEAREFEDFADVARGIQELQAAGVAFERDEGANQRADARAIDLLNASEIDEDVAGGDFGEAAQFGTKCVIAVADRNAALQIEDGDVSGFSRGNLQAHVPSVTYWRTTGGCRVRIITPQVLEQASDREKTRGFAAISKKSTGAKREVKAKRHSTSRGGWARCGIVLWVVLPRLTTQQPGKKPVSTD